ncbi:hypothetical protein MJA45_06490 [Paenibacillus aurantius]|uniref:Uncharacterized protein n=1 Tax=Paenibacillus aurantius TaxID=2918900 RepID=A0AA96LG57_9BACL|nr:hypothetical protein [Paenibacillus aurantius]WNQ12675.1 hypothetical protein MJA45_06490 [Paenibacillus aurantius]
MSVTINRSKPDASWGSLLMFTEGTLEQAWIERQRPYGGSPL